MKKRYEVYEMCNGVMQEPKIIYAKSPIQAVKIFGYETAVRTTDIGAPLLVKGEKGSYSYHTSDNLAYFRVGDCSPCVIDVKKITQEMQPFFAKIILAYAMYEFAPKEEKQEVAEKVIKDLFGEEK